MSKGYAGFFAFTRAFVYTLTMLKGSIGFALSCKRVLDSNQSTLLGLKTTY